MNIARYFCGRCGDEIVGDIARDHVTTIAVHPQCVNDAVRLEAAAALVHMMNAADNLGSALHILARGEHSPYMHKGLARLRAAIFALAVSADATRREATP